MIYLREQMNFLQLQELNFVKLDNTQTSVFTLLKIILVGCGSANTLSLWKAEAGLQIQAQPEQFRNLVRICLKVKRVRDAAQCKG